MKAILNIDWLSVYCDFSNYKEINLITYNTLSYQSRQFKLLEEWIIDDELFASVQRVPSSSILGEHDGIIKLSNRFLYQKNSIGRLQELCRRQGIEIKHITRLDICADFNTFYNNYEPEQLIKDFLGGKVLHSGRCKFTVSGRHEHQNTFEYLRIGKKTSDVHAYLYNKTKEMEDVKYKHYISEDWKRGGLDINKNVWRLEFSLNSTATKVVDTSTGELKRISLDDLKDMSYLQNLYSSLSYQYFRFKINDGQKNKSRMEDIILIKQTKGTLKTIRLHQSADITRSEKVLVKQLYQYESERRNLSREEVEASKMLLSNMLKSEHLREYVIKKSHHWDVKYKK